MNLQSSINIDLKSFFQWWGRELAFLIPAGIRRFLSDQPPRILFSGSSLGFQIRSYAADAAEPMFEHLLAFNDKDAYQNLKNQHHQLEKAENILSLGPDQALAKVLYLPEAALENLQQVVGFELDKHTPFQVDQVYFAAVPLAKTGFGQIQVLLVLSPRAVLDELCVQLNQWGVQLDRVEYQALDDSRPEMRGQYNLLPEQYRTGTDRLAKSVHWLLNSLMLVLFLAVLIYPIWQDKMTVDELKSQIKALEKDTRIVDAQQLEIDALRDETQRLIDIKTQTPEIIVILNELTHLFKDDSWLTNLQYSEKHAQIQGQSPMASALIGLLEASPIFSNVSFVSPLTQDKTTGLERFQISMDVDAAAPVAPAPPEPAPADANPAVPAAEDSHE